MKILSINTLSNGGAAKACIRLHQGLLQEGIDTKLLFKNKTVNNIPETYRIEYRKKTNWGTILRNKLRNYLPRPDKTPISRQEQKEFIQSRPSELEIFSYPFSDIDITSSKLYQEADIVNLHWVANFLDYPGFFLVNTKPVVWTLHDANPFLGGEHYAERFFGIDDRGYPVPRNYTKREVKESDKIIDLKRNVFQETCNIHIVAPSQWLKKESENSELFGKFPHHHIPYGFPTDVFKPLDRELCRDVLDIPKDKFVVLFVSESLSNFRKGYTFLKRSIDNLSDKYPEKLFLCAVGGHNRADKQNNILELGTISDERLMAVAYSAADVFVIPSLEDNLPNTMIESLLCGTPVIGFPTGGIAETVVNSFNGYLCPEISVSSLQETIEQHLLTHNEFDREAIRNEAVDKYSLARQAKKYISLYNSILGSKEF